jgi:hypothetical protein
VWGAAGRRTRKRQSEEEKSVPDNDECSPQAGPGVRHAVRPGFHSSDHRSSVPGACRARSRDQSRFPRALSRRGTLVARPFGATSTAQAASRHLPHRRSSSSRPGVSPRTGHRSPERRSQTPTIRPPPTGHWKTPTPHGASTSNTPRRSWPGARRDGPPLNARAGVCQGGPGARRKSLRSNHLHAATRRPKSWMSELPVCNANRRTSGRVGAL